MSGLPGRATIARDELEAWLRLLLAPRVGGDTARRVLAAFGSPQAVFAASTAELREAGCSAPAAAALKSAGAHEACLAATLDWLAGADDRHVVTLGDPRYPARLLQTADPPLLLHVAGDPALLSADAVAVVGSRSPSAQGRENAREFGRSLSEAGLLVVSGLALGIDAAAHEGALAAGASTLAVVGTGLDRVYPARHHDLAHRIAARGALVSEFVLGTPPLRENFPLRNRIIAGLSLGTLVVEAALRSGSLITARLAAECGREVFAVPGSIHAPQSRGCHALIRDGAKLVETAADVLDELQALRNAPPGPVPPGPVPPVREPEADAQAPRNDPLLEALGHDPLTLDALGARTGMTASALLARLLELELEGQVARLPGGLYQRCVRA